MTLIDLQNRRVTNVVTTSSTVGPWSGVRFEFRDRSSDPLVCRITCLRQVVYVVPKGGSRHKTQHYYESVLFFIRYFGNCSVLHRNA